MYNYPKTLLVNVPDYGDPRISEPLGLSYLAAYLKKEAYSVDIFDPKTISQKPLSLDKCTRLASNKKYDIIGASIFTIILPKTLKILARMKRLNPNARIVVGGHHATFTHKDLLEKFPFIDMVVRGEGEETLLEAVERFRHGQDLHGVTGLSYRNAGRIVVNPPRAVIKDLDAIPFPLRNSAYFAKGDEKIRPASLITGRGCPYRCSFCSINAFYGSQPGMKYRMRSPANIADEIAVLFKRFRITHINLMDDNSFVYPERLLKFTDILMRKKINLKYTLISRPDQVVKNRRYMPLLKKRGFYHVEMGVESASQAALDRFAKDMKVEMTKEAISILKENKMTMLLDLIMFDPDASIADIKKNIRFVKSLGSGALFNKELDIKDIFTSLDLHPGTSYYKRMDEEGRLKGDRLEPVYEFRIKDIGRLNSFLCSEEKFLGKALKRLNVSYLKGLLRITKKSSNQYNQIERIKDLKGRAEIELEFKKIYIRLFDHLFRFAGSSGISKKTFSKTKLAMKNELKSLAGQIRELGR